MICDGCGREMFVFSCDYCGEVGVPIDRVVDVFHIGRCPNCNKVNDEPCPQDKEDARRRAMAERPEWVKCIEHDHADLKGQSWCGRALPPSEFRFAGVDHAAENGRQGGRLVACSECVLKIAEALVGKTGVVIVPKIPTEAMLKAGLLARSRNPQPFMIDDFSVLWAAMVKHGTGEDDEVSRVQFFGDTPTARS